MSLIKTNGSVISTIAPIPIEKLKLYFEDKNISFSISYKESTLQGSKLLIYLSNLDIPCDIDFADCSNEEISSIVEEYLNSPFLVKIDSLLQKVMQILFYKRNIFNLGTFKIDFIDEFISKNRDIIDRWERILDSCLLYNFFTLQDETIKEYVLSHEKAEEKDFKGINFVHLFSISDFFSYYIKHNKSNFLYYEKYFNEYVFKGKNLYYYWSTTENPYFLLTSSIAMNSFDTKEYLKAKFNSVKDIAALANISIDISSLDTETTP